MGRIVSRRELKKALAAERRKGRRIVFTNGCFDILHAGHVKLLGRARTLGDILVVGLNSDSSVRRLKGANRPLMPARDRATILASLACVDYVVGFGADTPYSLIKAIMPDVLVKGGDYPIDDIVGADVVRAAGGQVRRIALLRGRSSSDLLLRARKQS